MHRLEQKKQNDYMKVHRPITFTISVNLCIPRERSNQIRLGMNNLMDDS